MSLTFIYLDPLSIDYSEGGAHIDIRDFRVWFGPYFERCSDDLGMDQETFKSMSEAVEEIRKTMIEIERHMKFCGDCINSMIDCGDLILIEDWWERNRKAI
jgi:hypothetical protein